MNHSFRPTKWSCRENVCPYCLVENIHPDKAKKSGGKQNIRHKVRLTINRSLALPIAFTA
jgi:hypothetical protein